MDVRKLGNTDLKLTTVGLGTWAIGGPWDWGWGPQDDRQSLRTIEEALDLGINWIDTAPCYGLGHSEEIVGQAISGRRDEVIIATKCGLVWDDPTSGTTYGRLKAASVLEEADASLRRLGVDVIDLYQIHWPDPAADIREAWEAMVRLVEVGKVRHIGVSNFSVAQLKEVAPLHPVASLQPPYSMLERTFEEDLAPWCEQHQVGVVAYSPMQAGLLTGTMDRTRVDGLPPDDWRRKSPHFNEPNLSRNLAIVDALRPIARELGCSMAQLAIAWTLRNPVVTSAIVGARRPGQIQETAGAMRLELPPDAVQSVRSILERP